MSVENSPDSTSAPKKLTLPPRRRAEIALESLGPIVIHGLTLDTLGKLGPSLYQDAGATDEGLVRAVLRATSHRVAGDDRKEADLADDDVLGVPPDDLERFAGALAKLEKWESAGEKNTSGPSSITTVATRVRGEAKKFAEITAKFGELASVFSDDTRAKFRDAFQGLSTAGNRISADLESVLDSAKSPGVRKFFDDLQKTNSGLAEAMKSLDFRLDRLPKLDFELSKAFKEAAEVHAYNLESPPDRLTPLVHSLRNPAEETAREVAALNDKIEDLHAIARSVEQMHAQTNTAVLSGLNDLARAREGSEKSAVRSLRWAVVALVVTAGIGATSTTQDFLNNRSNDEQQRKTEAALREQADVLRQDAATRRVEVQRLEDRIRALESKTQVRPPSNQARRGLTAKDK